MQLLIALKGSRIAVAILVALHLGLSATPQSVDLLIALGQDGSAVSWLSVAVGAAWLAINTWFWTRFALPRPERERYGWAVARLPGLLAATSLLVVAAALWQAAAAIPDDMGPRGGHTRLEAAAAIVAGAGVVLAILSSVRRQPASRAVPSMGVTAAGWGMLAISVAVGIAELAGFSVDPIRTAALVRPAATVLFAASGLLCGATLLLYAARRTRIPVLLLACLLAATLAALRDRGVLPDNHDLRTLPAPLPDRPDIETAFLRFLAEQPARDGPTPVILVAASGGGIAAAYWSATVLGDLADASPAFATAIFAMSGVSGGALGLLTYAAATGPHCRDPAATTTRQTLRACLQLALTGDFIGPSLGTMLYPDLLQRFIPIPVFADRAAALEHAWEHRWREVFGNDRLAQPLLALWRDRPWPALLLNATSLNGGGRLVISNLQLAAEHVGGNDADLLSALGRDLPASAAAGSSARFPLLGPLGTFQARDGTEDAVADGGYFENLGATTLLETLDALDAIARQQRRDVRFVVIQLINDPEAGMAKPDRRIDRTPLSLLPRGLTGPATILLRTREARGVSASEALARRVTVLGGRYLPVRLGRSPTGATAPLGWSLSAVARGVIDAQWTPPCRDHVLAAAGFAATPPVDPPQSPNAMRMDVMAMWSAAACRAE